MTYPPPTYPDHWPKYTIDASEIAEVFDGEQWRAVIDDGTVEAHYALIFLEGSPPGAGAEGIPSFVCEVAGQGNTEHLTMFLGHLPPVRLLPTGFVVE